MNGTIVGFIHRLLSFRNLLSLVNVVIKYVHRFNSSSLQGLYIGDHLLYLLFSQSLTSWNTACMIAGILMLKVGRFANSPISFSRVEPELHIISLISAEYR